MTPRPTPFDLVFAELAESEFPRIAQGLEAGALDPRDRDAFLLRGDVGALLQELHPAEAMGEGVAELAAFAHHAFLFWRAGAMTLPLERVEAAELLREAVEPVAPGDPLVPLSFYLQVPPRLVWAELEPGTPHEPLDGCFVTEAEPDAIRVLGVFGMHPDQMGFTVAEAHGTPVRGLARPDGTPLYSPVLAGGAAAGLFSIIGLEELLELGWRARGAARRASRAAEIAIGTAPERR